MPARKSEYQQRQCPFCSLSRYIRKQTNARFVLVFGRYSDEWDKVTLHSIIKEKADHSITAMAPVTRSTDNGTNLSDDDEDRASTSS